jgi:hypothetical protein
MNINYFLIKLQSFLKCFIISFIFLPFTKSSPLSGLKDNTGLEATKRHGGFPFGGGLILEITVPGGDSVIGKIKIKI